MEYRLFLVILIMPLMLTQRYSLLSHTDENGKDSLLRNTQFSDAINFLSEISNYDHKESDNLNESPQIRTKLKDDTDFLQNALNSLSQNGGTLSLPSGDYIINQSLILNLKFDSKIIPEDDGQINIICDTSSTSLAQTVLNVTGERQFLGSLDQSANKEDNWISLSSSQLISPGDALIITTDGAIFPNGSISFNQTNSSTITTITTSINTFSNELVSKSIVFRNKNSESNRGTSKPELNEPFTAATVVITKVLSETEAEGIVGNNNNLPSNYFSLFEWGITDLWNQARGYYTKGEIVKVSSVLGDQTFLENNLRDTYDPNITSVFRISNASLILEKMSFSSKLRTDNLFSSNFGLFINDINYFSLENIEANSQNSMGIFINECAGGTINALNVSNVSKASGCYAAGISSSQNISISNSSFTSGYHAISHGGTIPVREITIQDSIFYNNSGAYALDFHGSSENVTLKNVISFGGFVYLGRDLTVQDSSFYNPESVLSSSLVIHPEISSDYYSFYNSYIEGITTYNAFIQVENSEEVSFGQISLIFIDNCTIIRLPNTNYAGFNMFTNADVSQTMNYNQLRISNSTFSSEDDFAISLYHAAAYRLNLSLISITNCNITSLNGSSIQVNLWSTLLDQNQANTTLELNGNRVSSYNDLSFQLNNINIITIINNIFDGNDETERLSIMGYNDLSIISNTFSHWKGITTNDQLFQMLNSSQNIDSLCSSSITNIEYNSVDSKIHIIIKTNMLLFLLHFWIQLI